MRALLLSDGQVALRDDVEAPMAASGEALVKVRMAGICDTDLQLQRGYMGFRGVPGHEFVGEVVTGPEALAGRRVVGDINAACGACERCCRGLGRHCAARTVLGILGRPGAHAEHLCLPFRNLHLVPDAVPDEAAVFVEPLAAACEVLEQVKVSPADRVVVVGDGKLGLLIAQVLALTGCELRVLGRHREKLAILEARGLRCERVEPDRSSALPSAWADIVVECSGSLTGFEDARRLLRPRGTLVLKTTTADRFELDLASLVVDEITVVGSRCGPFDAALRLLERGAVDVSPLIAARRGLSEGVAAYAEAAARGTLKVLLDAAG
jgi:threonine dehydrogenase-like Zn-dependent dehydrogenase